VSVKPRYTSFSDVDLRDRHRSWGERLFMVDVDMAVIEYEVGRPVALLEYKHGLEWQERPRDAANLGVLRQLADGCSIPFVLVRWQREPFRFRIEPRNAAAVERLPASPGVLTEERYVRFLYWLRGHLPPAGLLETLNEPT
jgi:hypothetical protein